MDSYNLPFVLSHDVQSLRRQMWYVLCPRGPRRNDQLDLLTRPKNCCKVVPNETIHPRGKKYPKVCCSAFEKYTGWSGTEDNAGNIASFAEHSTSQLIVLFVTEIALQVLDVKSTFQQRFQSKSILHR